MGTRIYSVAFSVLACRRVTDATNGFRIFRASILQDPKIDIRQTWLDSYDLEPYVLYKAIRRGYKVIEVPVHRASITPRRATRTMRGLRDWWRLFRPAVLLRTRGEAMITSRSVRSAGAGSSSPAVPASSAARSSSGSWTPAPR